MAKGITNIAASVHQHLLNKAKESSRLDSGMLSYQMPVRCRILQFSTSRHPN